MKNALFLVLFMSLTLFACEKESLTGDVRVTLENGSGDVGIFDISTLSDMSWRNLSFQNALRTAEDVGRITTFEGLLPGNYVCAELSSSGTYYTTFQIVGGQLIDIKLRME